MRYPWDNQMYNHYSYQQYLKRKERQKQYDLVLMACMLMIMGLAAFILTI